MTRSGALSRRAIHEWVKLSLARLETTYRGPAKHRQRPPINKVQLAGRHRGSTAGAEGMSCPRRWACCRPGCQREGAGSRLGCVIDEVKAALQAGHHFIRQARRRGGQAAAQMRQPPGPGTGGVHHLWRHFGPSRNPFEKKGWRCWRFKPYSCLGRALPVVTNPALSPGKARCP